MVARGPTNNNIGDPENASSSEPPDLNPGAGLLKEIEEYKKYLQGSVTVTSQENKSETDPKDPLASLINQINQLKQQRRAMEGEMMTSSQGNVTSSHSHVTSSASHVTSALPTVAPVVQGARQDHGLELLEKLIQEAKGAAEPCPNVNPFPLASILNPNTLASASILNPNTLASASILNTCSMDAEGSETHKQLLQQRLIDRIKSSAATPHSSQTAVTTLTNSSYISPIPAVRLEPSPKTGLQMKDSTSLDSDIRLLRLLIPNFSQSGGAAPPNYTAVPVNQISSINKATVATANHLENPSALYSANNTISSATNNATNNATNGILGATPSKLQKQGGVMNNDKCLEIFQNIKKQISEQSMFNLTATIHQTASESEGSILVVTRNKIDIHPQFGPIHVARVVITNKLYYKFFVLDKVVNSGQVQAKEISEMFWKLSEVSRHILCPGFNQRYISKVEQTLGEKVEDITTSYCRLTAKLCTVWHLKDDLKPGQCRNYYTRDLCSECLDLYHRLQFKTYSHTKLKQQHIDQQQHLQQHQQLQNSWTGSPLTTSKRENDIMASSVAKKPKLNGNQFASSAPASSTTGGMTELQLKAVLSNLVNSRVVQQVNKESEGDDQTVDILGDTPEPTSIQPTSAERCESPVVMVTSSVCVTSSAGPPPNVRVFPSTTAGAETSLPAFMLTNGSTTSTAAATTGPPSHLQDILASLTELQRSAPDLLSIPGSVDEGLRSLIKQFTTEGAAEGAVTSSAGVVTSSAGVVTSSAGVVTSSAGVVTSEEDGAGQAEEDLLVIQED